ncbi:MAG: hypothetical protein Fur0022_06630 [Anaerolineales bacterium]
MTSNFIPHLHTLHPSGQPFVVATVVRAEKPTSVKPGAKAIITEDGKQVCYRQLE